MTINAKDTEGKAFANQVVSLGLNEAALSNGVSFASPSQIMTDSNGLATFEVTINPQNQVLKLRIWLQMIWNLLRLHDVLMVLHTR